MQPMPQDRMMIVLHYYLYPKIVRLGAIQSMVSFHHAQDLPYLSKQQAKRIGCVFCQCFANVCVSCVFQFVLSVFCKKLCVLSIVLPLFCHCFVCVLSVFCNLFCDRFVYVLQIVLCVLFCVLPVFCPCFVSVLLWYVFQFVLSLFCYFPCVFSMFCQC
eukprot:827831_1